MNQAILASRATASTAKATFFETRQFSPTSLAVIITLHVAAVTTALAWKMEFIGPIRPEPTTVIDVRTVTPPEVEARDPKPRPFQRDVFARRNPIPETQEDQALTHVTDDLPLLGGKVIDEGPPLPPLPPEPMPLQQSARAKGDVRTLISSDDYPEIARRNDEAGTVQARLSIGADGRVTGCSIVMSSRSTALDVATCRLLKGRARFTPAKDGSGQAVSDSYLTPRIVWKIEGSG